MKETSTVRFESVREWADRFLALFPHRYDYIWAEHPTAGQKVEWRTENRHPLSDRLIQQGAYLYGVRFGTETHYCLIDIDAGSLYHPKRDPFALARITAALEPLGFVSYLACTSSYSGGLHLYFPFESPQPTWELALVLETLLANAGFKPALGQLELFPNVRQFVVDGSPNLYAAHRLPLQAGSYLLTPDLQPTHSTQQSFIHQWHFAQRRNVVNTQSLKQTLKVARRRHYALTGKADKFLNDLNAEIEPGWSSHGQTNFLLGRIAMRAYIFGHILKGTSPLEGKALVDEIVQVATSLPGYTDWCRHQQEIEHRAEEWALCVQNSHYFHFGQGQTTTTDAQPTDPKTDGRVPWNQQQQQGARSRIQQAIADLLNQNTLPTHATARFHALTQYGIGGGSLYKHRDLWHPTFLNDPVETPLEPPNANQAGTFAENGTSHATSLLFGNDRNLNPALGLVDSQAVQPGSVDGSLSPEEGFVSGNERADPVEASPHALIAAIKAQLEANREAQKQMQAKPPLKHLEQNSSKQIARMHQYLESGDPILMAEALAWAEVHPGFLEIAPPATLMLQIKLAIAHLGWSPTILQHHLQQRYGKSQQALLNEAEWQDWGNWLMAQVTQVD